MVLFVAEIHKDRFLSRGFSKAYCRHGYCILLCILDHFFFHVCKLLSYRCSFWKLSSMFSPTPSDYFQPSALRSIIVLAVLVVFLARLAQAQNGEMPYLRLESRGSSNANSITLTCQNAEQTGNVVEACFFLNGSIVDDRLGFRKTGGELIFRITRDLEGNYTCSNPDGVQSNALSLVG